MKYRDIKEVQFKSNNTFYAFSKEAFDEQAKRFNGEKIYSIHGGLFGTKEGLEELNNFLDNRTKRISEECTPQEVYSYEFNNHECSYTNSDDEPIKLCVCYFGVERCREIKRRFAYLKLEDIEL